MWTRTLISLLVTTFTAYIGLGIIQPILPIFAKDLHASGLMLGLIFSAISIPRIALNPLVGKLSDKAGRKIFIMLGLGCYSIVAIGYTYVTTPAELLFVRIIAGVAFALVMPAVAAYVGSLSPKKEESQYMAALNMAVGFGIAAGPIIGGVVSDQYDFNTVFYIQAILLFSAFIMSFVLLPSHESYHKKHIPSKKPFKIIIKSNLMKGLLLSTVISSVALSGLIVFIPLLCNEKGLKNIEIGILLSVFTVISGGLQIPFGKLADRHDKIIIMICGGTIVTAGLVLFPLSNNFTSFVASSIVMAVGMALAGPAGSGLIIEHSKILGIGLGVSIGIIGSFQEAGLILGPILSGLIMDAISIYAVFYSTACLYIISMGALYYFAKIKKTQVCERKG